MHGYGGLQYTTLGGGNGLYDMRCPVCGGTGVEKFEHVNMPCIECNGTGVRKISGQFNPWLVAAAVLVASALICVAIAFGGK